jgi:serine/threonine-protein kinase
MDAAESVLRAGYRLDRYELLCPIASGGMATVWLARLRGKRGFEKLYAIKTIRTDLVDDPRFQEMFLDEARIASGIQHPNVAQILDLGEQEDVLFIVMEWVDGDSLAKIRKLVAKRGHRLPVGVVLRVLADACAGLHAAHELRDDQGEPVEVVHRDVSPQNVLLSTAGAVKVIDFGIAKAHGRKQGQTRTGIVKGKIQYMAPEQVKKGRTVDRRADVWALGVCLHELASGKLPYDGDDDIEVINKLLSDEAPRIAEGIPEPIGRVLERSMVLDVDSRFPTTAGMQRALEAAMKELGEATTSEDVAAFLRSELPELATRRREIVHRAVDEARERGTPPNGSDPDVAFAATVMSERPALDRPSDAGTIPLAKRKTPQPPRPRPRTDPTADQASQARQRAATHEPPGGSVAASGLGAASAPTSPTTISAPPASSTLVDDEPIKLPKTSRAWLWIALAVLAGGGGAVYRWPDEVRGLLAKVGIGGEVSSDGPSAPSAAEPSASAMASASVAPTESSVDKPAASASVSGVASAAASASALAAGPSSTPVASAAAPPTASTARPTSTNHHTWPSAHEPAPSASASQPAASAAPTSTWSPYKQPPEPAESSAPEKPYPGAPPL